MSSQSSLDVPYNSCAMRSGLPSLSFPTLYAVCWLWGSCFVKNDCLCHVPQTSSPSWRMVGVSLNREYEFAFSVMVIAK